MLRQYELVDRVKEYAQDVDEDRLNRAYVYAMQKHGFQKRANGDPYFSHPIEVAGICSSYKLDLDTIITALLHDTLEDTDATSDEIVNLFGHDVLRLVEGVTKLTKLEFKSDAHKQAENFRKLLLAMSEDIRVLLIKLADRLHNMRTLNFLSCEKKRKRIAMETLDIYAPLADRIGMQDLKEELEDLAFRYVNSEALDSILRRLDYLEKKGGTVVQDIVNQLEQNFLDAGMKNVKVSGRRKRPYSIWRKMQRKNILFSELPDIMAFRIVVKDVGQCYQALGVLHGLYKVTPGRFKDYISTPKPNGYRSIHTVLLGPGGNRIEVQIRTTHMHEVNDSGVAAHWAYKQGRAPKDGKQYRWLRDLLEILENTQEMDDFLENTKIAMFSDHVFCFTPKGEVLSLPSGSTPVDFAYSIHTDIGNHCSGARVNGRLVPLKTELSNGDQVEILTSKLQEPNVAWARWVVTAKARACIRRYIDQKELDQYCHLGRVMVKKMCSQENMEYKDSNIKKVISLLNHDHVYSVLSAVGKGTLSSEQVFYAMYPEKKINQKNNRKNSVLSQVKTQKRQELIKNIKKGKTIPLQGLISGMAVHYAGCCHPIPGDRIVGIITTGKGVTIHVVDCKILENFYDQQDRWLDVSWDSYCKKDLFVARMHLTVSHEKGTLSSVSTTIARQNGNITNLRIGSRNLDFFEMQVDVSVQDVKHLRDIMAALASLSVVSKVQRL